MEKDGRNTIFHPCHLRNPWFNPFFAVTPDK